MSFRPSWRSTLLSACAVLASAAEPVAHPPVVPATLVDVVRHVATHDPDPAAAAAEVALARAEAHVAGRWDDPSLEVEATRVRGPGDNENVYTVTLMQPFSWGRRNAALAGEAHASALLAAADASAATLLARVRHALITLDHATQRHRWATDDVEAAQALLATSERQLAVGLITETDRLRVTAEVAEAEQAQALAQQALAAATNTTNRRLGLVLPIPHDIDPAFAPAPAREALAAALAEHPLLRAAEQEILAAEAQMRAARSARLPPLAIGVTAERADDADAVGLIVEVGLPLWNGGRDQAAAASAALRVAQTARARRARDLLDEAEAAWDAWREAQLQADGLNQTLIPTAERIAALSADAYARGDADASDAITARRTLLRLRSSAIDAHAAAARARTELDHRLGRLLEGTP